MIQQAAVRNQLLSSLPSEDFAILAPLMTPVDLPRREVLVGPEMPIERSYFLEHGIASVIASTVEGTQTEIALIGREGLIDVTSILGGKSSPLEVFMQVEGDALCIQAAALQRAMTENRSLEKRLLRYAQNFLVQVSFSVVAAASLPLRSRLARWLLMCHDRIDGDDFPITHEFISLMLNVRRSGVTEAVQALEGSGAIRARRGVVTIRDRAILLDIAGEGYGQPETHYEAGSD